MIRDIITNTNTLQAKSIKASKGDLHITQDLLDTAEHNKERCCGLAAIQINQPVRIIAVLKDDKFIPIINPVIIKKSTEKYIAIEGCMSLTGKREVLRHRKITIMYENKTGKTCKMECKGIFAQIIQHEIDHCNGILI